MRLNQLWKNSPGNQGTPQNARQQLTNQPCKTCEDTVTGIPTGQVLTNEIGASGKEYFTLNDCPTCEGQRFLYVKG
jgi:hypothetical protein